MAKTNDFDNLMSVVMQEANGLCENYLQIYHKCNPDVPVDAIPFGQGFPTLPWTCPLCGKKVEDYTEMSFDIVGIPTV